jgi:hypothetical protein
VTTVKIISDDEIIISAVRFIFTTRRRYVRVDNNLWYNKDLQQEVTDYEMDNLPDEQLVFGKESKK